MDRLSSEHRSWLMSKIHGKNTSPEIRVRSAAHSLGLRFRLHRKDLPGTPDLIFPKFKTVLFIHGCFWHRHPGCRKASIPKSNTAFWVEKFNKNVERDSRASNNLTILGWRVFVIWECETRDIEELKGRLSKIFFSKDF